MDTSDLSLIIIDECLPLITMEFIWNKLNENCEEFQEISKNQQLNNARFELFTTNGYCAKIYRLFFEFNNIQQRFILKV